MRTTTLHLASLLSLLLLASCNILGAAAIVVHGPPKAKALHTLDKDRPTIVFVDDRTNRLPRPALRHTIAEEATTLLLKQGAVAQMIESNAAYAVVAGDKAGVVTPLDELAKAVSARCIILISVDGFALTPDGQQYIPTALLRAKVLDFSKPQPREWPQDKAGHSFEARILQKSSDLPRTLADVTQAELALARQCGKAVAQLFFDNELTNAAAAGR